MMPSQKTMPLKFVRGGKGMKLYAKMSLGLLMVIFLYAAATGAQTVLTNDSIVKMVKAGLGDDIILNMINSQPSQFAITPDSMIALKKDGVSDKVIAAMVG